MFGYDVFGAPALRSVSSSHEVLFKSEDVPTFIVKIDTTATGNKKIMHQLPHWTDSLENSDTFVPYGWSWAHYKTQTAIASKEDTHCFFVIESNDPNVPEGTEWGACSDGDDDDGTTDLCESVICSDLNRDAHEDAEPLYDNSVKDCCGECSTGYEEDDNDECQAVNEETPWILYGGLGLAGLACLLILKK